ncbi:solute carrier family 35 member C2-like [Xenia sp. Carnegie-2017]|uniref:solute carrier family 35 member C2-like n=1 Tax=Xenia sp. Carnegie-2017 TaxID=2897299 RepID=UPI001F03FF19|nr:solute carrier family 35 member C2-like [Xenia sp. Carnegie-2017]
MEIMKTGNLIGKALKILSCIVFMYIFSMSLTFYNKWIMKKLHFPLTLSMVHYSVVFVVVALIRKIWEIRTNKKRIMLKWSVYLVRVTPTAIATALDIGFSNWSLMFITVSLYTMCKTTAIIFILIFSILFGLEKFHCQLLAIVFLISGGLFMFTYESTQFNFKGFLLVMTASSMSGIRWATTQLLLQKESLGLSNPFDTVYHLQPLMTLSTLPLAIGIEGLQLAVSLQTFRAPSTHVMFETACFVLFGSFLAFMLTMSEYLLLANTSGITLAIAGIFKELCTIVLATELVGDEMNGVKFGGLVICLLGISFHVYLKASKFDDNEDEHNQLYDEEEREQMLNNSSLD